MKKILGLDLGTNSIGWALVDMEIQKILGMGSRIIPMDAAQMGNFDAGNSISQTAERTGYRGVRRLRERHLLRRERLHRVLNVLGFLPEHYANQIDFEKHFGQFFDEKEPKIAWNEVWNEQKNKNEFEFLFQNSFNEMVEDFKNNQPQLFYIKANCEETKIPYDWTIYYLRKKALSHKIEKEELAWILLNFNQKRGYYQLRGEDEEENPNKLVEYHSLKIVDVVADEQPNSKGDTWYSLHLENGWIYRRSSKTPLFDWKDKVRDFIVTTDLNDDGSVKTDKEGNEKRSFRAPSEDDWTLLKKKTETDIEKSNKSVGTYIYESLLQNPTQKIRGKLVRTIERKFYKTELEQILKKQIELQPELFTDEKYNDCVRELYKNNTEHQNELNGKNFVDLFVKDIIFYQRPLRSQKSNIGNCALEFVKHKINIKDEN
ncbi:MAG: type II CRISPR RNA-guided endonuclease Cas9, partial [Prevotellaceae bacterium]|nr:type II CRISPR RNA-guided endonuclease Cas9 [Prevotellaceae bacterium]